jgi:molybdenum cofactor cytidylyltransferase
VHRPELVSALSGAPVGAAVTPDVVARVLAHPEGGRKGVPAGARFVAVVNKAEGVEVRAAARETAARLLREPGVDAVLLTAVRSDTPVLERHGR